MLNFREAGVKAKAYSLRIIVINEYGDAVRNVADTKVDSFASAADLPDGVRVSNAGVVPIHLPGVEAVWTEGDGETTFVWDCKDEKGERVKPGIYYIELDQEDRFCHKNRITKVIWVTESKAA